MVVGGERKYSGRQRSLTSQLENPEQWVRICMGVCFQRAFRVAKQVPPTQKLRGAQFPLGPLLSIWHKDLREVDRLQGAGARRG